MIQRKQTLFLLLAALLISSMYAFPLVEYHRLSDDTRFTFRPWGLLNSLGVRVVDFTFTVPFQWVYAVILAGLGVVIFHYKNRPRQLRFLRGVFLLILGAMVAQLFVHQSIAAYLGTSISVNSSFQPAFFFPMVALVLCWLAERAIRKDEELVRSVDRLR